MYLSTKHGGLWVEAQRGDRVDAALAWLAPVIGYGTALGLIGSVFMAAACWMVR